ncbi:MAG: zinc ribbon domain-containing protein [Asgard group archaeon]|nr:zinc ribbon domain-containing protein [Asgard group archaeon]
MTQSPRTNRRIINVVWSWIWFIGMVVVLYFLGVRTYGWFYADDWWVWVMIGLSGITAINSTIRLMRYGTSVKVPQQSSSSGLYVESYPEQQQTDYGYVQAQPSLSDYSAPTSQNSSFCKNCGSPIEEGNRFCPYCGEEIS